MKTDMVVFYMIRGLLAILCGGTILFMTSTPSLAIIFSAYFLLDGIVTFIMSLGGVADKDPRWYMIGESVVNVAVGILIFILGGVLSFAAPRVSAVLLLLLVSARIILVGLLGIIVGVFRRKAAPLFRIPIGFASIVFGLIMIYFQDKKIFAFVLPIGVYAIVVGVFLILACLKLKDVNKGGAAAGI